MQKNEIKTTAHKIILNLFALTISFQMAIGLNLLTFSQPAYGFGLTKPTRNDESVPKSSAEIKRMKNQIQHDYLNSWAEAMKSGFGGRDPALRDIMAISTQELQASIPDFTKTVVDEDPFFMRSQKWLTRPRGNSSDIKNYSVIGDENQTELLIPGSSKSLSLNLPLQSLIETDEYLFFTLHPKSTLLKDLTHDPNAEGDGLFVIETALLPLHAERNTPVPVFFLPIMGNGWRGDITALHIVEGDILAIANSKEVIPFLMKDIREMIQISKINLDMSVMISLTRTGSDGTLSNEKLMPAPGSTALLGLVSTGLDLRRPGYNFFRDFHSLKIARMPDLPSGSTSGNIVSRFGDQLLGLIIDKAEAQTAEDPVTAAIWRSAFFGSIVATTIVIAFALKYKSKAVRQRLDEIKKYRRALDPETVDREKWQSFRDFMRIEGSILASIAQFPLISPSIAVQYFVDRHAPALGSGDHTLLRKTLNQTVYPNLRHFGKIAVNEKVTILGTGYAATVGVGVGALHYFYLLPAFVGAISTALPDGLSFALNETFSSQNRETQATLFTQLLVSASIGILRGPADFTMDAKSQVIEDLYARVDNALRREGINPDDPKVQSRREEMRDALVNLTLVQKGLPTSKEVLFDTMSLYTSVSSTRGFSNPTNALLLENVNPNSKEIPYGKDSNGNTTIEESSFILASRRGLLPSVLRRAKAQAEAWNETSPSLETDKALHLINEIISETNRVKQILPKVAKGFLLYLENPSLLVPKNAKASPELTKLKSDIRSISERALWFRQMLVMSNYEGPIEYVSKYLPKIWSEKYGPEATNMAVLYLRQALASYLEGSTLDNVVAKSQDIERYSKKAVDKAIETIREEDPRLNNLSRNQILNDPSLKAEILQRSNILAKAYGDENRRAEKADAFKPALGWVENFRHKRALKRAEVRLAQYTVQNPDPKNLTKENLEAKMRDFYIYESGRQIGIRIQNFIYDTDQSGQDKNPVNRSSSSRTPWQTGNDKYMEVLKQIQENSEILANRQFEGQNIKAYLAKLSPLEASQLKLQLHAAVFLTAYRDAITMNGSISGLDSSQPGMTQGIRVALTKQTDQDLAKLDQISSNAASNFGRRIIQFRQRVVSITASQINRGLRVIDSMFNDQSVERGVLGAIQRRVPFAEELVSANIRNVKFWPVAFTVSWVWSHFALGTGIAYDFWVTSILTQGIFIMMPVQWLFRNYRMQEFKPYDSDRPGWSGIRNLAAKYSLSEFLGYAVTFVAIMPAVLLTTEVGQFLTTSVGAPVARAMQNFSVVEAATALFTGTLAYVAGNKFYERWKMNKTLSRLTSLRDQSLQEETLNKKLMPQAVKKESFINSLSSLGDCGASFIAVGP